MPGGRILRVKVFHPPLFDTGLEVLVGPANEGPEAPALGMTFRLALLLFCGFRPLHVPTILRQKRFKCFESKFDEVVIRGRL